MVNRLLQALAGGTHAELAKQVQFLKVENEILRAHLPARITVTPPERRRLLRFGLAVGAAIGSLLTIVSARTFRRWAAEARGERPASRRAVGRPRTRLEIRELIVRMATENDWGYGRIFGELRKLGIDSVSQSTIANILRAEGVGPRPGRDLSWKQFLRMHAETLWACDFLSKTVWTFHGRVRMYVLFFIHVHSRCVIACPAEARTDGAWTAAQVSRLVEGAAKFGLVPPRLLVCDRDRRFGEAFAAALARNAVDRVQLPVRSPNLNAHAERWVQTFQNECLDHFIVLGADHLDHLVSAFLEHYHGERPHQGLGQRLVWPDVGGAAGAAGGEPNIRTADARGRDGDGGDGDEASGLGRITCRERLGGLLRSYARVA